MLDRIEWLNHGWPSVNQGQGPSVAGPSPMRTPQRMQLFSDDFQLRRLALGWQWPWNNRPIVRTTGRGDLILAPQPEYALDPIGAAIAHVVPDANYRASVALVTSSLSPDVTAGLTGYGSITNAIGISYRDGKVVVFRRREGKTQTTAQSQLVRARILHLRIAATGGNDFKFFYAADDGAWHELQERIAGASLPPWDLGVRIALTCGGSLNATATFRHFRLEQF